MITTCLCQPFLLAEVTVSANLQVEFDQAGLVMFANRNPADVISQHLPRRQVCSIQQNSSPQQNPHGKWVKAALQTSDGDIGLATTVAHPNCGPDWSFISLVSDPSVNDPFSSSISSLKIKLERVSQDLWIWYQVPNQSQLIGQYPTPLEVSQQWRKAREIIGFFAGVEAKGGVYVGCYASRPLELDEEEDRENGGLFVEFEDLEIL